MCVCLTRAVEADFVSLSRAENAALTSVSVLNTTAARANGTLGSCFSLFCGIYWRIVALELSVAIRLHANISQGRLFRIYCHHLSS